MKLVANRYGKSRVRLLKVLRDGPVHTVKEVTARVLVEGDFDRSYTAADNRLVVATDTMKNTLQVLAHDHLGVESEPFARVVADHVLGRYAQVSRVTVELEERVWARLSLGGAGHPHAFRHADVAAPFTRLVAGRNEREHVSGVRDLTILKSTGSGFEGFHRDAFTTLPETRDRILATAVRATWRWAGDPPSHRAAAQTIVDALLAPFAGPYSPSVQATLMAMGTAALEACPAIDRITLAMPNLHCLPVDLTPFGRANAGTLFVPTDEPHGDIEATVARR